ncbi:glycosyltransferase family 4 protein [Photobacterium halotolerans]|nr:glycosyltransferase family 4 protein [Photobacterium halotolerans]
MIKIAHVQLLPMLSGVQKVSLDELARLDTSRYKSFLICKEEGELTEETTKINVENIYVSRFVRNISPVNDFLALIKLYLICKRHKFDVVHTHSSKTGVLGRIAAKLAGVPKIVHTVHGFAFPASKSKLEKLVFLMMERIGGYCSNIVICLHNDDAKIAINEVGVNPSKVKVVANGVDCKRYSPPCNENEKQFLRSKFGFPVDAKVFVMVGRLWKQKNPLCFINSALSFIASLNDKSNVKFVIVGDGELRYELERLVSENGADDFFSFLGWRKDVELILKASDFFVLPSLWEGMPLAILEAQSCGLPCIVSNIPGNCLLVDDYFDGVKFDLKNKDGLSSAIKYFYFNDVSEMKLNSRRKIVERFDVERRVSVMCSIYES